MKRLISLAAACAAISACVAAVATAASGTQPMSTLNIALSGTQGVSVSGNAKSGAVNIVSTFSGKPGSNGPGAAIFRKNPGVSTQQVLAAAGSNGDPNAVSPYGAIVYDAAAPSTTQVVLTPGDYLALNVSGNGPGGYAEFKVTPSASPAALPAASATQTTIEFGFRGPTKLHNGTMVRAQNHGYLVHMIAAIGVASKAKGKRAMALLRAGKDRKAGRLFLHRFFSLAGPISTGAVQQSVLHAKPGWYVEACFMNTEDGREHTQLGMERLIKVVK